MAESGLIAELKRRNVIRMAGLYLVGAWLLTQVAGTVLPMFGAPEWMPRSVVILLALGFVPALVFAWVFELTPDGLKRDAEVLADATGASNAAQRMNRLIVATLALAVVYFCVDKFALAPKREAALVAVTTQVAKAEATTQATQAARDNSIAVLPFVNMSDDTGNQFFSDGISEELLNVLVRVDGLSVASRTSSFAYRGKSLSTQAIGRELNVSHVLEGSVRKAGNKVRITAQLIDAVNDRHLWSKTYDRELTDIFVIQDEIANAIVNALRDTMAANAAQAVVRVRADTQNMAAYELYLKAREKFIARTDLAEAVSLFERAVALDPEFARGWEGLAAVSAIAPGWNLSDRDYTKLAGQAADRALQLEPTLSMPWAVKAVLAQYHWPRDYDNVFAYLDKAIAADPKNATAFLWRSIVWMHLGFFQRGITDSDRCLALQPHYPNCVRHKALNLLFQGKEPSAIDLFNEGITATSKGSRAVVFMPPVLARGDRTGALLLLQDQELDPALQTAVLQSLDHPEQPLAGVRQLLEGNVANQERSQARLALWLRDYEQVAALDKSGDPKVIPWERYPLSFRNSPGMKRHLANAGVVAYWRTHGFPPQCRAVGAEDFTCD